MGEDGGRGIDEGWEIDERGSTSVGVLGGERGGKEDDVW